MRKVFIYLILWIVLILGIAWFARGDEGEVGKTRRVGDRVLQQMYQGLYGETPSFEQLREIEKQMKSDYQVWVEQQDDYDPDLDDWDEDDNDDED